MFDNKIITAQLIPVSERIHALSHYFKKYMLSVEANIYHFMKLSCQDCKGGFRDFYRLDNGGFYMAMSNEIKFDLSTPSDCFHGVDGDTTGIIICLYAYNFLANKTEDELLMQRYYHLRDYAYFHPQGKLIFKAID